MISVPNHLPQLNGNRLIGLLIVICVIVLQSCSSPKSVYTPSTVKSPEIVEEVVKEETIDTVVWEVTPEEEMPPISTAEAEPILEKKRFIMWLCFCRLKHKNLMQDQKLF